MIFFFFFLRVNQLMEKVWCIHSDFTNASENGKLIWGNVINIYSSRPRDSGSQALGVSACAFVVESNGAAGSLAFVAKNNRAAGFDGREELIKRKKKRI